MKWLVLSALGGYLLVVALVYVFQRSLMYAPGGATASPSQAGVAEMAPLTLRTADALDIVSWYGAPSATGPVAVIFQGNAGALADRGFKARVFLDAGFGVLLVGYRGYSGNPGKPSEAGLYADARAALDYLRQQSIDPQRCLLYGESLGTALAVQMAMEVAQDGTGQGVGAVVLEAPFSSMAAAASVHYPWLPARWLVRDRYDSIQKIREIAAPLLLIHGALDRTVPYAQGRSLYDTALQPKQGLWLEDAGHNDVFEHGTGAAMLAWIRENTDLFNLR